MNDRAEQAEALIEEIEKRRGFYDNEYEKGSEIGLMFQAAALLRASEAEVTRLQAGIRRALTVENRHTDKAFYVIVGLMVAELEAALSQPTTDTNGEKA